MGGGLIQLVAKSIEDLYIHGEPQITFFKTVYRRHTNFSKQELDILFTNSLDFGKEGRCKIKKYGDLLHRLYLVIRLPEVQAIFRSLTVGEVKELLSIFNITWNTTKSNQAIFNEQDYEEVSQLIDERIAEINSQITTINQILPLYTVPNGFLFPAVWFARTGFTNSDVAPYITDNINAILNFDPYNLIYKFVVANAADRVPPLPLATSNVLQLLLFDKFVEYGTGATSQQFDPASFNDENLFFYFNVKTANYSISGAVSQLDASTVFRTAIDNVYGAVPYAYLDAYKIFNESLIESNSLINNNFDIQIVQTQLLNNIQWGLSDNIRQMTNIYNSLQDDAKFMFYRLFRRKQGGFDTASTFNNLSLFTSVDPALNDNFTSDFPIILPPGQPANIFHPMSNVVSDAVQTFHQINRADYRNNLFNDYFNALFLWSRTDIGQAQKCITAITGSPTGTIPQTFYRMYFMNYIPFFTNDDIPTALNIIMQQERQKALDSGNFAKAAGIQVIINQINPLLTARHNIIEANLNVKICIPDDFVTIASINGFRSISGENGDIIITSIIRQNEILLFNGAWYMIPEYIILQYQSVLNNFETLGLPYFNELKPILQATINLFATPQTQLPSYTTYESLNYNQKANLKINTNDNILSDAISSIWYNLSLTFKANYNNLYYNEILGEQFYVDRLGVELSIYLSELSQTYLGYNPVNPIPIDYYTKSTLGNFQNELPLNGGGIGTYLNNKLAIFLAQLEFYFLNERLMTMKNLIVPKSTYFYERFRLVLNYITLDVIEVLRDSTGRLVYDHTFHGTPEDPVILIREALINPNDPNYDPSEPHNNAMDIIILQQAAFNEFILTPVNPYSPVTQPNKYRLWNQFWLPFRQFDPIAEERKYQFLYGSINAPELYKQVTVIQTQYNGFLRESDVYKYTSDIALNASVAKDIPSLASSSVTATYANIVNYFTQSRNLLIDQRTGLQLLDQILQDSLRDGDPADFAWVQKIGHYIIDYIQVKIGDQLIDTHYGEWLEIWHQVTRVDEKERGYNILIGNVDILTTYDSRKKPNYEMIIPMRFWFNRDAGASIPLVALQNTTVEILVKLKDFNLVSYQEQFTTFRTKPRLDCKLIGEFIYLEEDERERIVKSKNEYLIDILQYNGNIEVSKQSFIQDELTTQNSLLQKIYFNYPCRGFYWVMQNSNYTNGTLPNGNRLYAKYSFDTIHGERNPAKMAKILFDSREREVYHDSEFYNFIQPGERHTSTPPVGMNVYCFALDPEPLQPSGSVNLGRIDDAGIDVVMRDDVVQDMNDNNTTYQWRVYGQCHNILRVFSGMAGLAFFY